MPECACPTRAAHADGCEREPTTGDTLCRWCALGHNEPLPRWRFSRDTPVILVVSADKRSTALSIVDDVVWDRVWARLDEVAIELARTLGMEVAIGFPYDGVEISEET